MKAIVTIIRELWGLFVDDGSLAFLLLLWCLFAATVLPKMMQNDSWSAPALFIGCAAILLANVIMSAGRLPRHK